MKKKFTMMISITIILLNLVGCGEPSKIVNNSIITDIKVNSLGSFSYGSRGASTGLSISTDKGDFAVTDDDYAQQLKDLYNLKVNNNKNLIVDIVYDNSSKIENKLFRVKEIIVVEHD